MRKSTKRRWERTNKMPPISANAKKPKNAKSTLQRVIRYLAAYRFVILGIFLLCILSNVLSLMGPSFAGSAVNAAAAGKGKVDFPVVFVYAKKNAGGLCHFLPADCRH